MPQARSRSKQDADAVAAIVAAARRCFDRQGVAKTWMGTVASEAGIARQTLYRFVAGRQGVIELVLAERCGELMQDFAAQLGPGPWNLRADLVELMAVMVERCSADPEFSALAGALPREQIFEILAGPSRLRPLVEVTFKPLFEQGRAEGTLRRDVSDEDLAGWIQSSLTPLAGRDIDPVELRWTLTTFVIPAVLNGDT